jgi:hypothetical protein
MAPQKPVTLAEGPQEYVLRRGHQAGPPHSKWRLRQMLRRAAGPPAGTPLGVLPARRAVPEAAPRRRHRCPPPLLVPAAARDPPDNSSGQGVGREAEDDALGTLAESLAAAQRTRLTLARRLSSGSGGGPATRTAAASSFLGTQPSAQAGFPVADASENDDEVDAVEAAGGEGGEAAATGALHVPETSLADAVSFLSAENGALSAALAAAEAEAEARLQAASLVWETERAELSAAHSEALLDAERALASILADAEADQLLLVAAAEADGEERNAALRSCEQRLDATLAELSAATQAASTAGVAVEALEAELMAATEALRGETARAVGLAQELVAVRGETQRLQAELGLAVAAAAELEGAMQSAHGEMVAMRDDVAASEAAQQAAEAANAKVSRHLKQVAAELTEAHALALALSQENDRLIDAEAEAVRAVGAERARCDAAERDCEALAQELALVQTQLAAVSEDARAQAAGAAAAVDRACAAEAAAEAAAQAAGEQAAVVLALVQRCEAAEATCAGVQEDRARLQQDLAVRLSGAEQHVAELGSALATVSKEAEVAKAQEACMLDAAAAMVWALAATEADASRRSGPAFGAQQAAAAAHTVEEGGSEAAQPQGAVLLQSPQEVRLQVAAKAAMAPASTAAADGEEQQRTPAASPPVAGADAVRDEGGAYARLHALKAVELRALLIKVGLPSGGTKAQLVARLTGSYADAV